MDAAGNVVSSTYTLNHNYGSGITIPADTIDILKAQGYTIKVSSSLGSLQSIMKYNGVFLGAADPRRPGSAAIAVDIIDQPVKSVKQAIEK
jgi:gamma-glutamyltranspeptidase